MYCCMISLFCECIVIENNICRLSVYPFFKWMKKKKFVDENFTIKITTVKCLFDGWVFKLLWSVLQVYDRYADEILAVVDSCASFKGREILLYHYRHMLVSWSRMFTLCCPLYICKICHLFGFPFLEAGVTIFRPMVHTCAFAM
jgi:hypothetical protein